MGTGFPIESYGRIMARQRACIFAVLLSLISHQTECNKDDRFAGLKRFQHWFTACDGWLSPDVHLEQVGSGAEDLGLVAKVVVPANQMVAVIPHHCMLRLSQMRKELARTQLGKDLLAMLPGRTAEAFLLLERQKSGAKFRDFFASFPSEDAYSSMPTMLPQEKLRSMLAGSGFVNEIENVRATLNTDYALFLRIVQKHGLQDVPSRQQWLWACYVWKTRGWSMPFSKNEAEQPTFFPIADLLLHSDEPNVELLQNFGQKFAALVTKRRLHPSEALYHRYGGSNTNRELFLHWGFLPSAVDYSKSVATVSIPFGPQCTQPFDLSLLSDAKGLHDAAALQFARRVRGLEPRGALKQTIQSTKPDPHCDAWLDGHELRLEGHAENENPPQAEVDALGLLLEACSSAQKKFTTTLQQDTKSLKKLRRSRDRTDRNLMLLRMQEKTVLQRCIDITSSEIARIYESGQLAQSI